MTDVARYPVDLIRAWRATARASGRLDLTFASYARHLAIRLMARAPRRHARRAAQLLITPVNSVRYWEFPFVWRNLPSELHRCLDVGSPRLFSLRVADERRAPILMINPDSRDASATAAIALTIGLPVRVEARRIEDLQAGGFDCVWSISVVEHISGDAGDSLAMRTMFDALRPGGRLIVTVSVDRTFRAEYRKDDPYGLVDGAGGVFFQRFYDATALRTRLFDAVGIHPVVVGWYGERRSGAIDAYTQRWLREGWPATVADPTVMADEFSAFPSWEAMPGAGVAGLVFDKP